MTHTAHDTRRHAQTTRVPDSRIVKVVEQVENKLSVLVENVEDLASVGTQQRGEHLVKIVEVALRINIENGKDLLHCIARGADGTR